MIASAVIAGSLIASPTAPAMAAAEPTHTWTFSDSSGSNWTVPAGVSQVWVGIHGGSGGKGSGATLCHVGTSGNQFSVLLDVNAGDVITTFAGKDATGKGDQRIGGKGYINGGDGGKRSVTSSVGGGGGGAGAVKLNGELIAVAGAAGGCGGDSGYYPNTSGGMDTRAGGEGGSPRNLAFGDGKAGEGKKPGSGGSAGKDDASFVGYHKPGQSGSNAGTGTSGGGGGGGGAGYPSSGAGGGAGHGFAGFNGGGGGGAGLSWVKSGVEMHQFTQPEDSHYKVSIPAADDGTSKITIPLTTATTITGPATVHSDEAASVRVRTGAWDDANSMLDGSFKLLIDGVEFPAVNPGSPSNTRYSTNGDRTIELPPLSAGSHTVTAEFIPTSDQSYWNGDGYTSTASMTVEVEEAPVIPDDDEKANTSIALDLPEALSYGDAGTIEASLTHDGAEDIALGEGILSVMLDGNEVASFPTTDSDASITESVQLPSDLPAGVHRVAAAFTGSETTDGTRTETQTFTVAQATTTTSLTAPDSGSSGTLVEASAQVTATAAGITGTVALLADDAVLTSATVDASGAATFPAVRIPAGTTALSAQYLGDGNFSGSVSDASGYAVLDAETRTTLELSTSEAKFGTPVAFTATVSNLSDEDDPLGEVEILVDGEVVATIPAGLDSDTVTGNAEAMYEMEVTGLMPGSHQLHARFVPAPGFAESATATPQTLTVLAIDTRLSAQKASGTTKQPAVVEVEASLADDDAPVDGYVEAFVASSTQLADAAAAADDTLAAPPQDMQPVGAPAAVENGTGAVELSGLPAGTHEVTLRFTPEAEGHLGASTTVQVKVTAADGEGGSGGGGSSGGASGNGTAAGNGSGTSAKPGSLSRTGSDLLPLGLTAGALILVGAAAALIAARRRGSSAE